MACSLPMN